MGQHVFPAEKYRRIRDRLIANAAIFFCRKDVLANGKIIRVAIDQFEGEHSALSRQHSAMLVPENSI
jgi:hypothetical protein